ncbi:MAG: hypothetical protein HKN16_12375 [Saprospiraceae bacterium]|nr:hypothetical protein [Saprospiraceae bacterium]
MKNSIDIIAALFLSVNFNANAQWGSIKKAAKKVGSQTKKAATKRGTKVWGGVKKVSQAAKARKEGIEMNGRRPKATQFSRNPAVVESNGRRPKATQSSRNPVIERNGRLEALKKIGQASKARKEGLEMNGRQTRIKGRNIKPGIVEMNGRVIKN